MVYFNCTKCGTGLKKSQVEQHMFQCRSRLVSCIDCQKDFRGEEFKSHVKCLTESERYESKDYVAKANKGDLKQSAWIEKIGQAVATFKGSGKAKSLLEKMAEYPNVPRKKVKFFNFVRNSFRFLNLADSQIDEIWSVIEAFDNKSKQSTNQTNVPPKSSSNAFQKNGGQHANDGSSSPPKKRKLEEIEPQLDQQTADKDGGEGEIVVAEFDWLNEIKRLCVKKLNNEMPLENLEKKLYKRYKKHRSTTTSGENNTCQIDGGADGAGDDNVDEQQQQTMEMERFRKKLNKKLKKLNSSISLISSSSSNNHNGDQSIMVVKYLMTE